MSKAPNPHSSLVKISQSFGTNMKSLLFWLLTLTSPPPFFASVEQLSPASSRIPRLHTHGNTIWDQWVCVYYMCVSHWVVSYVSKNSSCLHLNPAVFVWLPCMSATSYICVCVCVTTLMIIEAIKGTCLCVFTFTSPQYEHKLLNKICRLQVAWEN